MSKLSEKKDIFIQGDRVYLRALTEEDIDGNYRYWLNSREVNQFNSHGRFPQTSEKLKDYVRAVSFSGKDLVLAVVYKATNEHIGNISLQNINWIDRNAEIAFLLGQEEFKGKGVMLEAGNILIHHGFDSLNLHRIYCGTSSENHSMQKLAANLKMLKEGIRKDAIFKYGRYHDVIEFGIINPNEIL